MKKYLIGVTLFLVLVFFSFCLYFVFGFYIDFNKEVTSFTSSDSENIYVNDEKFVMKGVNLGAGLPGHFATEFAIDKETYTRWFKYIQEMGANTIRVYTILAPEFYEAFYDYNKNSDEPLYLVHGVWVDDYILNSKADAYNSKFQDAFLDDIKVMMDVIHGRRYIPSNDRYASGLYTKNISKWVIGYILGVEWEDVTVAYTDHKYASSRYEGEYISTKEGTSAFVNMLAYVGDMAISYESEKYGEQRLLAFSNWPTTDPFDYSDKIMQYFKKCAKVDVENIIFNDNFIGGTFASYHVYPYYPDYLNYEDNKNTYVDSSGKVNTYYAYLKKLNDYHTIPVVISEFGVSTGRGMAQRDQNTSFNQGNMTEKEQGEALVSMYESIISSGCAGGVAFTWQDEWFKRTWNTMQNVDLNFTPYWSDIQTNEQYFGLLSFDPGNEKSISYVDGSISEWTSSDIVSNSKDLSISMKYDEKYIYLMAEIDNFDESKKVYIPLDITPNSGSRTTDISLNTYDRDIDFLIEINGRENSRVYVHEYYDSLMAMFSENITGKNIYYNPPVKNSTKFNKISLILQTATPLLTGMNEAPAEIYETGILKYGNGNPSSEDFDSLADFIIADDVIEIRIPWQLLNFSNPSKMMVHDDYYKHYGVENMKIEEMYVGIGLDSDDLIRLSSVPLEGWGTKVTYHERLKDSYYILKDYWTSGDMS